MLIHVKARATAIRGLAALSGFVVGSLEDDKISRPGNWAIGLKSKLRK